LRKIFIFVSENKIKEILLLDDTYKKSEKMSTALPKKCGKKTEE